MAFHHLPVLVLVSVFLSVRLFEDPHTILMRHLAGVGGKEASHCFAGVACQRVTLFLADAIVAHLQVIHAAGFLQIGKRGQEVFRLVGVFSFPSHAPS